MTFKRPMVASAFLLLALLLLAAVSSAQGTVRIDLPKTDPFPAAPEIILHARDFGPVIGPLSLRLRMSLNAEFGLIVFDSTVVATDARFITMRLLPANRDIFVEGSVVNTAGVTLVTQVLRAGRTGDRITLRSPNGKTAVTLASRQPTFSWSSAAVTSPPGPWVYELFITNVARQETRSRLGIVDTTYTIPDTLQANTSYRWKVVGHLANGFATDSSVASSESSFIIAPADAPVATLLYQNFPNPFPAPSSQTTCIWFDLQLASHVELMILDIRGNRVKTIIPGQLSSDLGSGRYGRRDANASGCDPRTSWDGTADNGRGVPPGVYLVRFKTNTGVESVKKIVYLGR